MSKKLVLVIALVGLVLSTVACGGMDAAQDATTVAIGNDQIVDTATAMQDSEDCGLGVLWQRTSDDAKVTFLAAINEECQATGQSEGWDTAWNSYSDVSWADYQDS